MQKLTRCACGLALVGWIALLFAGCGAVGGGDGASGDPIASPPIHVGQSRAAAPVGYTPAQVAHAYGVDLVSGNGAGQTIAIVDAYGSSTIQNDLNKFSTQFGLPTTTIQIAYPAGKPKKGNAGWALETALDVEWAHAIAPGATILLVVAPSASISALMTCVDYGAAHAAQVSMSWGAGEFSGEGSYDPLFNKPGVTFTASTGDSGGGPQWPSVSPWVLAVGGTTLSLDGSGNVLSETAWSGSNGGTSRYEAEPSYQTAVQSSGKRQVPDVSYLADPATGVAVYDSTRYSGQIGWFQVGGTSAGAPMWAALAALVNGGRATPLGPGSAVYSVSSADLRDIILGSNASFTAGPGYDLVTGLGSPLANALVPALQ